MKQNDRVTIHLTRGQAEALRAAVRAIPRPPYLLARAAVRIEEAIAAAAPAPEPGGGICEAGHSRGQRGCALCEEL